MDIIDNAILKSNCVIIPVRPAFFDVDAVTPVVEMCRHRRKLFSFVLVAVDSKMPRLVDSALSVLTNEGPVFANKIRYLQAYISSTTRGMSAAELDKSCQPEIDAVWTEAKRLAASSTRERVAS